MRGRMDGGDTSIIVLTMGQSPNNYQRTVALLHAIFDIDGNLVRIRDVPVRSV